MAEQTPHQEPHKVQTGPSAAIFGCAGADLSAEERTFFRDADPWGFILFARNVATGDRLRRLTADLRESVGREAPILIDQEGGRVARLRAPLATEWAPAAEWAAKVDAERLWSEAELHEALRRRYRVIAAELRGYGVDVNCAPLADLAVAGADAVIGDRALGADPVKVAHRAQAVMDGLIGGGALGVIKHLPGHGRATADSHHELPVVGADLDTLESDFRAFEPLAGAELGMTAHVVYAAIDEDQPATTSPVVISSVIRERIGFAGALMSDDLCMNALSGPASARAEAALAAGCDLALHCSGELAAMTEMMTATPRLAGERLARCEAALKARPEGGDADIGADLAALREMGALS